MSSYPYRAIDLPNETRILTISPGEYEDAVVCSLEHMPLNKSKNGSAEKYECLSYCWSKSVQVEFVPPGDAMVGYMYGSGEGESGQIPFRDMLDHPELHRTYIQFGGDLPAGTITCDGIEITVGGELHRAIRRIRNQDASLRIWIDALCIDQGNLEERNRHVLMMGSIYAGASCTRIWLGEATGIELLGFEVLEGIREIIVEALDESTLASLSALQVQEALQKHPKTSTLDWESLKFLFSRAWFRRVWILQEALYSCKATVYVGSNEFDWDWITSALRFALEHKMEGMLRSIAIKPISVMDWLRRDKVAMEEDGKRFSMPLLDVLEETRVFESTLASDKIYGLLGFTGAADRVVIDYALDAEEVFTQFAANTLRCDQSLDILAHCMLSTAPSRLSLPSWVPDWTVHGWVEPFRSRSLSAKAAGDSKTRFGVDSQNRILSIWGKVVGKVEAIENTKVMTTSHDAPESLGAPLYGIRKVAIDQDLDFSGQSVGSADRYRDRFHHLRDEARNTLYDIHNIASPQSKPTQEIRERMARTFAFGQNRDGSTLDYDFALGFDVHTMITCADETVEGVYRWMVEEATGCDVLSREGRTYHRRLKKTYETFIGSHFRWSYNRRFLRTAEGSFGWGVNGAEAGDLIVVFYGGNYPFILREESGGQYKIIGDCYLEGFMNGEAMSDTHVEQMFDII